jgi:hypothetical protein
MGNMVGIGSGSSKLIVRGRSSRREIHRLKSGSGEVVNDFMRMLMTTSGL